MKWRWYQQKIYVQKKYASHTGQKAEWTKSMDSINPTAHHHNRFTALFPGPPRWASGRREFWTLLCKGRLTEADTDHPAGRHSIQTNKYPLPSSPLFNPKQLISTCRNEFCMNELTNELINDLTLDLRRLVLLHVFICVARPARTARHCTTLSPIRHATLHNSPPYVTQHFTTLSPLHHMTPVSYTHLTLPTNREV